TLLPRRGCTEEDAVPVHVFEAFAIVVPDGVERTGRAEPLTVPNKSLNVEQSVVVVRVDAGPVVNAGSDPGLEACVDERREIAVEAARLGVVGPGYGDGGVLEGLRHLLKQVRGVLCDVSPEEQL